MRLRLAFALAAACVLLGHAAPAHAHAACPDHATDNTLRPVPASLVPAVIAAFGLHLRNASGSGITPAEVARQTVIRCDHGAVLACMTGANLNCGPADTRLVSRGGDSWCADHPDAAFVPMFATGHATNYAWRCAGTHAVPGRQTHALDKHGFVTAYWRRLNA